MKKIIFIWDWNSIHFKKWISFFVNNFNIILISDIKLTDDSKKYWDNLNVKYYDFNVTWNVFFDNLILFPLKFILYNYTILKEKPNIVHIHFVSLNVLLSIFILFNKKIKKIASFWWSDYNIKSFIRDIIRKIVARYYNIITSDTEYILGWLEKQYKVSKNKLFYINHWVDTKLIIPWNKNINYKNRFVIFSPRWLTPLYNHHILFKNINKLIKTFWENILLVFIDFNSNYNYKQELLEKIKQYPNNIELKNSMSQNELMNMYKNSDIVISIPSIDWFPITIIESILNKKPVIWLNHYDYVNNLPKELLINKEKLNIDEIIKKIEELKNFEINDNLIKKYIEKFDYNKNMNRMLRLYNKNLF